MSWLSKQIKSAGKVARKVAPITRFTKYIPGPIGALSGGANLAGQKGKFGTNLAKDFGERAVVAASLYGGSKALGALRGPSAASAASPGGMSGAGGWPSDLTDTGASGGGAMGPAGQKLSGGRQLLRNLLSGGKPLTFKNALGGAGKQLAGIGGGGLAGGLKTAAGIGLSLDQLRAAKRRRELSDKMLGSSTNIAGELGARGRSLIQGADTLRVPAESAYAKLLAAGQRPSVDPSRFADTLNPYRKRFGGMAA